MTTTPSNPTTLGAVLDILDRSVEAILRSENPVRVYDQAMQVVIAAQRALSASPSPQLSDDLKVYEDMLGEALYECQHYGPIREA